MGSYRRPGSTGELLRSLFRPLVRGQTYRHGIYLLVAVPLIFLYALVLGFGLTLGIVTSVLLVGIPILALSLYLIRLLSGFERWLAGRLLSVELEAPDDDFGGGVGTLRGYVKAPSTWRGLGFLTVKCWFGLVGLVLVFGLSVVSSLAWSLIDRPHRIEFAEVNGESVVWTVQTLPEAALAGVVALVGLFVMVHLTNLYGYVAGRISVGLLQ